MHYLFTVLRNLKCRFLGGFLKIFLLMLGCEVGKDLRCMSFPRFREIPYKNFKIGNKVRLGYGVIFEISPTGFLHFGNNVLIGDYCTISSASEIHIGDFSGMAENVSLRGSFHQLDREKEYMLQKHNSGAIQIGRDCGIGAGTIVLLGATLPDGVFIGSASLVLQSSHMETFGIYAGNPLKLIRKRQ